MRVSVETWTPRGVDRLETNAWLALRHEGSTAVMAGPGAGKTEFLAQRATYLLETGLCRPPHRILAISFKTDSANNLAERVRQRCPAELSDRFVSVTFDSFTKGLVDRFRTALPTSWRPTHPYDIAFPKESQVRKFLATCRREAPAAWQAEIASISARRFEAIIIGRHCLQEPAAPPSRGLDYVIARWWRLLLPNDRQSSMTFVGLNRLADLLLRSNDYVRRALRATYPFVLVDEFQDTTYAQYGFLVSAFGGGQNTLTAVGDDKQRIMVFAGARLDAFSRFRADFGAEPIPLRSNFRSSPGLVSVQGVVARALDPNAPQAIAQEPCRIGGDSAQIWRSQTIATESTYLARWLAHDLATRGQSPRDYALLVKQKAEDYADELHEPLAAQGLRLRNESQKVGPIALQDLMSERLCKLAIAAFRLGSSRRSPAAWQMLSSAIVELRGIPLDDSVGHASTEVRISSFLASLRTIMQASPPTSQSAAECAAMVFSFLDLAAVARTYIEYRTGELLEFVVKGFIEHLVASCQGAPTWPLALDTFEGIGQIPLLTVHKSKGLEYDSTVFLGLDDDAWWSHVPGDQEGVATFFVAASRAKQRAVFSYCQQRGQRIKVAELYQLLRTAGVREIEI